ncbi:hypothetical protein PYW08_006088 [Mythimna loreyi]|uniref:Uncharacterized protein n=1 Tax=Mythimna loreyi TaxID=667449 RepID=A0ACC2QM79_9NEOP|nr:hypothetical protein PYW08_006088 [Mythimna loreyi]
MTAFTDFFDTHGILRENLIGVCTDGAPSMIGCHSGFETLLKEKNPSIISTHCMIHRQALAAKTLPEEMNNALKLSNAPALNRSNTSANTSTKEEIRRRLLYRSLIR